MKKLKRLLIIAGIMTSLSFANCYALEGENENSENIELVQDNPGANIVQYADFKKQIEDLKKQNEDLKKQNEILYDSRRKFGKEYLKALNEQEKLKEDWENEREKLKKDWKNEQEKLKKDWEEERKYLVGKIEGLYSQIDELRKIMDGTPK